MASPVRSAYAACITLLLLFVAVCFHTARRPRSMGAAASVGFEVEGGVDNAAGDWSLRPRGGFYAHLPKVPIYAALVLWLLGGPLWVDSAVLVANALATLFVVGFVGSLLQPCAPPPASPPPGSDDR